MIKGMSLARQLRSKVKELRELRLIMRIQFNWLTMQSRLERKESKEEGLRVCEETWKLSKAEEFYLVKGKIQ